VHQQWHKATTLTARAQLLRVSSDLANIVVPHRVARKGWFRHKQDAVQKVFFDAKHLGQWLNNKNISFDIEVIRKPFPNDIVPLFYLS